MCYYGHWNVVKFLATYLTVDDLRIKPNLLQTVCEKGYLQIARFLVSKLTREYIRSNENRAFYYACKEGHLSIVKLLSSIFLVQEMYTTNQEAFLATCENGHLSIVEYLSQKMTILNATYQQALQIAQSKSLSQFLSSIKL